MAVILTDVLASHKDKGRKFFHLLRRPRRDRKKAQVPIVPRATELRRMAAGRRKRRSKGNRNPMRDFPRGNGRLKRLLEVIS